MEKTQTMIGTSGIKVALLFALSIFLTCGIKSRAAEYLVSSDGIYVDGQQIDIDNVEYSTNQTITLNGAAIGGTLTFMPKVNQGNDQGQSAEVFTTTYTMVLNGSSTLEKLALHEGVTLIIQGSGSLTVKPPETDNDGSVLSFATSTDNWSKLIIEGGTLTFDANYVDACIKACGCIYIKKGAKEVTFIGATKTNTGADRYDPVILTENSIPKIFSDCPCMAEYIPGYNEGATVHLQPNDASTSKTYSSTSLLGNLYDKYHKLNFVPGVTATWQNDGTVVETDVIYPGQTPEYNGETPTKAADAQYTYTFSGWSPTPGAISADTTYNATYTGMINSYTLTFNANGQGSAPSSQSVEYGQTATKPSDPIATGYNFGGWYTDSACTSAYDFTTRVTSDITLYAKWTIAAAPVNTKLTDTSDSNGTYTVISDSNGTYTVISDSDGSASVKFTAQKKKTEKVTIPSAVTDENGITYKVTSIAANAFKGNKKIKKLTIPETVTTIEKCAFKNCKNLKKITFNGDSLKSVCKNSLKGINKNAKIYIRTNDKKTFKKIKKMLKKAGAKNVTFKQIKT